MFLEKSYFLNVKMSCENFLFLNLIIRNIIIKELVEAKIQHREPLDRIQATRQEIYMLLW